MWMRMKIEIAVAVEAAYPFHVGQFTTSLAHSITAFPSSGPRKGGGVAPFAKPTSYLVSSRWRNVLPSMELWAIMIPSRLAPTISALRTMALKCHVPTSRFVWSRNHLQPTGTRLSIRYNCGIGPGQEDTI